jgi:glucosylceramidase
VELHVTTLDASKLLEETALDQQEQQSVDVTVTVDTSKTFQEIDGFGYTLTGGSAMHLQNMSEGHRTRLLEELFGNKENSIGVSYLRLSVGGSDLDERTWSYNDLAPDEIDTELERFSLAYDTLYLIPTLKEILDIAPNIKLMASPWSPPAWMKDPSDTRGGSLKPEFYTVYAEYLTKYVLEMKAHGIVIDALTVQNEPLHPENNPSLLMLASEQADFVKNHLGPTFQEKSIHTKIVVYDHNADRPDYPISVLNDMEAAKFIDGSAFHLYAGSIDALSEVREVHPTKNIYFTEQWVGAPSNFAGDFSWHIENLIIGATRNWSKTVLEWNLAADENQEPHTDRGGCERCLGALTINDDHVTRNTAFYVIAQIAKFVPAASVRVASSWAPDFPNVAFRTPDGKTVVVVQNKNQSLKTIEIENGDQKVVFSLDAGAVATLTM